MFKYKPFHDSIIKNLYSSEMYMKSYKFTTRKSFRSENSMVVEIVQGGRITNTTNGKFFVLASKLHSCDIIKTNYSIQELDEYRNESFSKFKTFSNLLVSVENLRIRNTGCYFRDKTRSGLPVEKGIRKFPGTMLYLFLNSEAFYIKEKSNYNNCFIYNQ